MSLYFLAPQITVTQ